MLLEHFCNTSEDRFWGIFKALNTWNNKSTVPRLTTKSVSGSITVLVTAATAASCFPRNRLLSSRSQSGSLRRLRRGGGYYVNLPVVDNWAMYGAINTTWTKLRIVGARGLKGARLREQAVEVRRGSARLIRTQRTIISKATSLAPHRHASPG